MSVTTSAPRTAVATTATGVMIPQNMDQAIKLADMMSRAKSMLPAHFANDPGACLLVIDQAMRWEMSPIAVAQATFVYKGRLGYEGKLVAAAVENSHAITGLMDYRFEGTGPDRCVIASATRRGEKEPREVSVVWKDAKTDNEHWKKSPDQMLVYHSARVWARRWTPGVILGVYTKEELDDPEFGVIEGERVVDTGESVGTRDAINASVPLADEPTGPEYPFATRNGGVILRTGSEWIAKWRSLIDQCQKAGVPEKIVSAHGLNVAQIEAVREFDPAAAADVERMVAAATVAPPGDDTPPVDGEDRAAA